MVFYLNIGNFHSAGIPGVLLAVKLVRGCLGRKWTLALSFYLSGVFIYGFLIPFYTPVRNT